MKKYSLFLFFLILNIKLAAQDTEFHPELDWYTIKGKNVVVHYHEGTERTAAIVAKIVDEVWGPITSLYNYEPETVHFIIKDIDDYSNGSTSPIDNRIEIWSSALDFDLRGTHNWLRNVISHEFTHLVQIQAGMKSHRTLPAVSLQFLNYEDKRRPDILYGFPNVVAAYPIAFSNIPPWLFEGTAQYMRKEFQYEDWDSHRDMILRCYALDGKMLTLNQMGVFSKTSLGNESVYNSGFAFTRYIAQKYGEDKLRKITETLGETFVFTTGTAFEKVLGKSDVEVYNEWKEFLTEDYKKRTQDIIANKLEGRLIAEKGFGNFYPSFSPDGKKISYVSIKDADYFGLSNLYLYDVETKEEKLLVPKVRSSSGWTGNKIIYAKLGEDNPGWANLHDLYSYDIETEEEKRLTEGMRANNPSVSKDGKQIVFVFQKDGTSNIGVVDIDGKNFRRLTFFESGEQVYNPKFSPDGKLIVFDYSDFRERDIAKVKSDGSGFEFLIKTGSDERNPSFMNDDNIIYSSDETGIFNLYSLDITSGEKRQLSNVIGGAFMSASNEEGDIVYAGYTSGGYKIFHMDKEGQKSLDSNKKYIRLDNPPLDASLPNGDFAVSDANYLKNFNDKVIPRYEPKKYSGAFTSLVFFPFIRYDNYNTSNSAVDRIKPGLAVFMNDMIDRYSFFASGSINKRWERDLYFSFEYRNKLPLLFNLGIKPQLIADVYSISRKANTDLLIGADSSGSEVTYDIRIPNVEVTYNLFEFDLAARHRIFNKANNIELRYIYSKYTATIGSFSLPLGGDEYLFSQKSNDVYLRGSNFQFLYTFDAELPYLNSDINPIGLDLKLQLNYEMNEYNPDGKYDVVDGILKPLYDDFDFPRAEIDVNLSSKTFENHTLALRMRGGSVIGPPVPDFFDSYLGGLLGMKSYPFYSISGNDIAWINLTYRFPLFQNIDYRLGHLYMDKVYLSVFGDIGDAWTDAKPKFKNFKKGVGAELRIKLVSYYIYPTSIFVSAAYGFDKLERSIQDEIVRYGKEWQFYGGILYDFSL